MHKTEEKGPINYVTAAVEKPVQFDELWDVKAKREIYSGSKLFWQVSACKNECHGVDYCLCIGRVLVHSHECSPR